MPTTYRHVKENYTKSWQDMSNGAIVFKRTHYQKFPLLGSTYSDDVNFLPTNWPGQPDAVKRGYIPARMPGLHQNGRATREVVACPLRALLRSMRSSLRHALAGLGGGWGPSLS